MDGTILNKKYDLVERVKALEEGGGYELPVATDETLGGVKIGEGLSITEGGVLSANAPTPYTPPAYSTTETNTGQKWIDGKDIYCCVFDLGSDVTLASNTWVNMSSYISITGWDKPVGGSWGRSSDGICLPLGVAINGGYLEIKLDIGSALRYLALYYTKTEATKKKK